MDGGKKTEKEEVSMLAAPDGKFEEVETMITMMKELADIMERLARLELFSEDGMTTCRRKETESQDAQRYLLLLGSIGLAVSSATNLVVIWIIGQMVNAIVNKEEGGALLSSSFIKIMVIFSISSLFTFMRAYVFTLAGDRVVKRLRFALFSKIVDQDIAFFDEHRTGEILNRLSDDCGILQNTVTTNVSMCLRNIVTVIGALLMNMAICWKLTLVMMSVVPLLAVSAVKYGKYVKTVSKAVQDALAAASATAEESISNVRTVRSFCGEQNARGKYSEKLESAFELAKKRSFAYGSFAGFMNFLGTLALAFVFYYGGLLVLSGELSIGELSSFNGYTIWLAASIGMLTSLFNDFMKAIGASKRVFELLDRDPSLPIAGGDVVMEEMKGLIEFRDVHFSYPSRPESVEKSSLCLFAFVLLPL
ncbi:hypothetical protein GUITHDRAFT_137103 [Guillardia theta CCMP2712]|uniref:ABC transmembrane type-1 domain-containing protein n=1 Tax=Guillardia theta (strain CCMP2712) TaxID=905079 RepID=L1JIM0_GUITC|nr:hypothetical protein GUITHDRAFT_137103 [Guillardia theta CCMP2712]EKX48172.1 hypothetical protein GUITHDRAFT_137103 [Guillardia theta CCMP2712]|eukprot:XP_005835152.1 hypothetical protein GUITHDRAFT_137103 [Guillardia theta CCMP2712]